ncbi:MAG: adenosylcobinamide-GDP ribazoletransferase [Amaricoccus sp.]
MSPRLREEAAALALAWLFLTRVPLHRPVAATPSRLAASLGYFPAVGAVIGAIGAAVLLAAGTALPAVPAVVLSIAATCLLTGALHEDGLADTCDGLGAAGRQRALAIMRDSRIGSYGALGLGLTLALKVSALAGLAPGTAGAALVAGHSVSRLSAVALIATGSYARAAGTAGFTAAGVRARGLALAGATGAVLLLAILPFAGAGAVLTGALGLATGHGLARALFERRLGGYTGDCLGATQQLSEAGFYLGMLAWL